MIVPKQLHSSVTTVGISTREYGRASDNEVDSLVSSPLPHDNRRPFNLPTLGASDYRSRNLIINCPEVK